KVFIIDEVHMLSKGAFNALLKTLEEPPPHVKFIFATTEIRKVPVTVLSRCQRFDLRRVDVSVLVAHFKKIAEAEGATADDDALALIARAAEGSVRDGLSILDQAIAMGQGAVTADGVRAMIGLADRGRIFDLLEALLGGQAADALSLFDGLHRDGGDPLQMMGDLADTVHAITRAKVSGADAAGDGLSAAERARAGDFAERLNMAVLARAWQLLARGLEDVARAPDAKAGADMVLVRLAYTADLPTPGELIKAMGGEAAVMTGHGAASSGGGNGATARGGTPPMRAIAGGGRSAPAPQPAAREAAPDTRPADAAAPGQAGPQSFFDVIALASQKRDAKLKMHLEDHVRLVAFDQGRIEISTLPEAPANLANMLGEKLSKWTGQRWIVSVSSEDGAEPVGDGLRREAAAKLADVSQHPAVRAVLDGLPGVEITGITPLATGAAESAETAPADGGPVDGVAGGDDVEPDDE
ncbi:MAG: DNA polymerase III subunit gamma/tau, partial [Pseudomonadota bacterium]